MIIVNGVPSEGNETWKDKRIAELEAALAEANGKELAMQKAIGEVLESTSTIEKRLRKQLAEANVTIEALRASATNFLHLQSANHLEALIEALEAARDFDTAWHKQVCEALAKVRKARYEQAQAKATEQGK